VQRVDLGPALALLLPLQARACRVNLRGLGTSHLLVACSCTASTIGGTY
jgi:hypothetical protein